jgi:excisionase family DNA binding protein
MRAAILNEAQGQWEQTVPAKDWYTVQDVCVIMDVGGPSVYGAIKRGTLKAWRVQGVVHVKHEDLLAYLARRSAAPSFDPSALVIEEIIPGAGDEAAAEAMGATPGGDAGDLEFLEE